MECKFFRISDLIDLLKDDDIEDIFPKYETKEELADLKGETALALMLTLSDHIDFEETA